MGVILPDFVKLCYPVNLYVNWLLRLDNAEAAILPMGLLISLVVASLLGVTGWFGAELIYRHKVAVIGTSSRHET
jgi:uncharacterized membrane protein